MKKKTNKTFFSLYKNIVNDKVIKDSDINNSFNASEIDNNIDTNDENDNDDENDENKSHNILSFEYV